MDWTRTKAPRRPGVRSGKAFPIILTAVFCIVAGVVIGMSVAKSGNGNGNGADNGTTPANPDPDPVTPEVTDAPRTSRNTDARNASNPTQPAPTGLVAPIRFDPPQINVGILKPGEVRAATTSIVNTSDAPITIAFTRASCTCTSINLGDEVIPAGGSIVLEATYDARQQLGPKSSSVSVGIEGFDPAIVEVLADVSVGVRAIPAYLSVFDQMHGEFVLESLDGEPFNVLSFGNVPTQIIGWDPETDDPQNRYRVAYDLRSFSSMSCTNPKGERMPGWLFVETDHPDAPVLDLIIRHECTRPKSGPWYLSERRILVGEIPVGTTKDIEVSMKWLRNGQATDTMRAITTTSDAILVDLLEVTPQRTQVDGIIRVTPKPGHAGGFYAELQIHGTGAVQPLILIGRIAES